MLEQFPFLKETIWDITIFKWLCFIFFITIGTLLRKYIAIFISSILYKVLRKFFSNYSAELFKKLLAQPVAGLVSTVFFFIGIVQLLPKIDKVIIIPKLKTSKNETIEFINNAGWTLFDLLYMFIIVSLIYFGFLLLNRIIEFVIKMKLHNAILEKDFSKQQILPLIKDILKVVITGIGVMVTIGFVFKVDIAAVFAGLGVGGVAIAFAAKESLENLIASFMVLLDKPFTIGDWVKVAGTEGVIEKIGFRSSRIRTFDKSLIVVPNRTLINSNIENFSERGLRRVKFTIGAIYGNSEENLNIAMEEIKESIAKIDGVAETASVEFDSFGDSQLNIVISYFVRVNSEINFADVKEKVNFLTYKIMYEHCHGFAFPTQTSIVTEELNDVN